MRSTDEEAYLKVNTSGFPLTEHSPVAQLRCPSVATATYEGCHFVKIWDVGIGNGLGALHEITDWIKEHHASYLSGIAPTFTGSGTGIGKPVSARPGPHS